MIHNKIEGICKICQKIFYVWPSQQKKFCSMKCRDIAYKNLPEYNIFKGKNCNFYKGNVTEEINCLYCGKKIRVYISEKRKFCNNKCANRYIGFNHRGDKHGMWKGGKRINTQGYVDIFCPDHPFTDCHNYYPEHRLVMEKYLGRFLYPSEKVHHINKNITDNRIENLELFANHSEHMKHKHPHNRSRKS